MNDVVSRSAVLEIIEAPDYWYKGRTITEHVDSLPAVDIKPAVRCNQCKFYEQDTGFCQYWGSGNQLDGFCNKGERMDGEE